jgi:predicted DNA-binding transcriptional regulator
MGYNPHMTESEFQIKENTMKSKLFLIVLLLAAIFTVGTSGGCYTAADKGASIHEIRAQVREEVREEVNKQVKEQMDQFIKDYETANPKK